METSTLVAHVAELCSTMQAYLLGTDTDRTRLRLTCHLGAALSEVNHRLGPAAPPTPSLWPSSWRSSWPSTSWTPQPMVCSARRASRPPWRPSGGRSSPSLPGGPTRLAHRGLPVLDAYANRRVPLPCRLHTGHAAGVGLGTRAGSNPCPGTSCQERPGPRGGGSLVGAPDSPSDAPDALGRGWTPLRPLRAAHALTRPFRRWAWDPAHLTPGEAVDALPSLPGQHAHASDPRSTSGRGACPGGEVRAGGHPLETPASAPDLRPSTALGDSWADQLLSASLAHGSDLPGAPGNDRCAAPGFAAGAPWVQA